MSGLCPYKRNLTHLFCFEYEEEGVSCEPERGSSLDAEPWSSYQSWENFFSVVCKPPALCCFDEQLNKFVEELRTTEFRALSTISTIAGCSQRHPFPSVFRYGHVLDGKYDVWEFIVKWQYSTSVLWIRHGWSLEGLTMPDQRGRNTEVNLLRVVQCHSDHACPVSNTTLILREGVWLLTF